jgi:ABC-2 type transport system ATP-binding protein
VDEAPIIRTERLTKVFAGPPSIPGRAPPRNPGGFRAVDALDLEVRRGEIFGLLGPNGAGKTTTIGMLTTRVIPTEGRAEVAGIDVVRHPVRVKQRMGVVSQGNTLDRSLTVADNLYFHGRYFGMSRREARAEAERLLALFRLADRANADVATLSGGMAQRLMVARAVLHRPDVLFLDEPTTGLDPQSRLALWDLIREMNAAGHTVLITTHYMEEADRLCDRIAIMDHGRILALDAPAALKRGVGADRVLTVSATGDLDALAARLAALPAVGRSQVDTEAGARVVRVYLAGDGHALGEVIQAAESVGAAITDLSIAEPSLETVFIALTGRELRE